jgi:hypothetical protein
LIFLDGYLSEVCIARCFVPVDELVGEMFDRIDRTRISVPSLELVFGWLKGLEKLYQLEG